MIDTPEVMEVDASPAAVIRITIPRSEMVHVMGPAIAEVMATLLAQGMTPAGPLFAHHLTLSDTTFDFEVGFPVYEPITAAGRVIASEIPGGRIACTLYHGAYEGLYEAWSSFGDWMKAQGYTGRGDIWESYITGPESGDDTSKWKTLLNIPLT